MSIDDVYTKIQEQLNLQLPFVVYRKADTNNLSTFFQKENTLFTVNDFSESGFIFAPFDHKKETVLLPYSKCSYVKVLLSINDLDCKTKSLNNYTLKLDNQISKENHINLVQKGISAINSGVLQKVVLSRKEEFSFSGSVNVLEVFKSLICNYEKAFVYLWYHPKVGMWFGATPEILLKSKNNEIDTMALAGTLSYKSDVEANWGEKELKEQKMVADFIEEGLSSISDKVVCSDTYTHRAGTLLHLRTDIKAIVDNEDSGIADVIKILHPTPAVCGLPKEEAKTFILKSEQYDRKFYTGFLGELNIGVDGETESSLFVNLRCMELENDKAILYVGGGITKDSDPKKEWEETVRKTETMKKVLF